MTYYEDLLELGQNRIFEFFKNVELYESQFKYSDFNNICLNEMYTYNNQDSIKTVKELKNSIPDLKATCKSCGDYYMKKRNNSIKKYDVQLGRLLEDVIIEFFNSRFKLNVTHGDNKNKKYPDCMLLGTDKGILAYFEVKYHSAPFLMAIQKIGRYCYEGSATLDLNKIIKQIELIESDLDRPVFYLHWIDYPCLKGIFFETSEQVKNELFIQDVAFERKERYGDYVDEDTDKLKIGYTQKFYSKLLEMGTFEELVDVFQDMKKNGIQTK